LDPQENRSIPCDAANIEKSLVLDSTTLVPNSGELASSTQAETVGFMDETAGFISSLSGRTDTLRDSTHIDDTSLGDFLSRPVLLKHYDVPVGINLNEVIFPWDLFFSSTYTVRRMSNFKLLQAKLHLKFVINGSPFHYGRVLCSYNPMAGQDELTYNSGSVDDFVALSQRPHVYLNPCDNKGGEIVCPFFWNKNSIDISSLDDFIDMGGLSIRTLVPFKHANGAVDPVTLSVYAWASDVKLDVPTAHLPIHVEPYGVSRATKRTPYEKALNPDLPVARPMRVASATDGLYQDMMPNASEYSSGPISRPASAVAAAAGSMTSIPFLKPYALATQIGAGALAKVASLFGYSRPALIKTGLFRPTIKGSMATCNQDDDCHKLSLDVKQELSIDPCIFGGESCDEMEIKRIAGTESYLTSFNISPSNTAEQLLWNCIVDPQVYRVSGTGNSTLIHSPACAFASYPFKQWRGSMKYRFQIMCSAYHRGRIKIVYDPTGTFGDSVGTSNPYNTNYTSVIDFRETTDFTYEVGWGQATSFRNHPPMIQLPIDMYDTTQLPYYSPLDDFGNGTIAVYVVTELAVPNSTVNNDITVNVFVSAGDDFEVAVPSGEIISNFRLLTPDQAVVPTSLKGHPEDFKNDLEPNSSPLLPNSAEEVTGAVQDENQDSPELETTVSVGPKTSLNDDATLVHYGESIRSFRQLIKRYSLHEQISIARVAEFLKDKTGMSFTTQRHALPFEPGYTNRGVSTNPVPYTLTSGKRYALGYMTPLRYLTSAFVGWRGGVRYMTDLSTISCCENNLLYTATRYTPCNMIDQTQTYTTTPGTYGYAKDTLNVLKDATGQEGATIANTAVNPNLSYEVPYYSEYRFAPGRRRADFSEQGSFPWMPSHKMKFQTSVRFNTHSRLWENPSYSTYVAAAEDFQVSCFIGAPPFFLELTRPVS